MSLLLDDIRAEFARYLTADPSAKFRMDAALAHVVTLAYQRGLEDGAASAALDKINARIGVDAPAACTATSRWRTFGHA